MARCLTWFHQKNSGIPFYRAFKQCGLDIQKVREVQETPPTYVVANLFPEYTAVDNRDLNVVELWVALEPA